MNTPKGSFGRSSSDALSIPALKGEVSRAKTMNIANEFIKEHIEKHFQMLQSKNDVLIFYLLRPTYSSPEYWSDDGELLEEESERGFKETSFHLGELDLLRGMANLPIEKEKYAEVAKQIPHFNKASENLELLEKIIELYKENIDDIISLNTLPYSEPYMSNSSYDFITIRERPRTFSAGMNSGDTEGVLSFSQ